MGREGGDSLINRSSSFDEENNRSGPFDEEHKIERVVLAKQWEVPLVVGPFDGLVDLGGGAVIDRDCKPFLGDIEGEVLAHDGEACQAYAGQSW